MKEQEFDSLGLKGRVQVPESVEEFDKLAKKPGACLEEATNNVLYRGVLADFRDAVVEKIIERTGIQPKTKPHPEGKKDEKTGEVIQVQDESEARYVARVEAQLGVKRETEFQAIADEVCKDLVFDPSARERQPKVDKPGKTHLEVADAMIAQGKDKLAASLAKITAVIGRTVSVDATREEIALAVKHFQRDVIKSIAV